MQRARLAQSELTAKLELNALERMIGALCNHIEQLATDARSRGALNSREADLQWQVFAERRTEARRVLENGGKEPHETRAARLQKHVEALDCSRAYFRAARRAAAAGVSASR